MKKSDLLTMKQKLERQPQLCVGHSLNGTENPFEKVIAKKGNASRRKKMKSVLCLVNRVKKNLPKKKKKSSSRSHAPRMASALKIFFDCQ